jgi:hypothetical protein
MLNDWNTDLGMSSEDARAFYKADRIEKQNSPAAVAEQMAKHFAAKKEAKKLDFPIDQFPAKMQEITKHYVKYRGYSLDFFGVSIISAIGTAVGNSHTVKTPNGYINKANTFIAIVAPPGTNKSAPPETAYRPLAYKQYLAYQAYKEEKKRNKENSEKGKEKTAFLFLKQILSDITPEALIVQLAENPKGCVYLVDELAGFFSKFDRYAKGGDEEMFLSLWQGSRISRDTLSGGTLEAYSPFLSILGTIQPSVLHKSFVGKTDNGFADRWLICYPNHVQKPYPGNEDVNPAIEQQYNSILSTLTSLYDYEDPQALLYNPEAYQVVFKWICTTTDIENHSNTTDTHRGIFAKLQIYIHRFALIMQLMEYGCTGDKSDKKEIGLKAAIAAVALAEYFFAMAEKTRLKAPAELLTGQLKELYDTLPEDQEFKTTEYLTYCGFIGYEERTAKEVLRNNIGKLWNKLKHGTYVKI